MHISVGSDKFEHKQENGEIYRLQGLLPISLLNSIYYDMIYSHLSYLIGFWDTFTKWQISELQVIQNRTIRNINYIPWEPHIKGTYSHTQIRPLWFCQNIILRLLHYKYFNTRNTRTLIQPLITTYNRTQLNLYLSQQLFKPVMLSLIKT